MVDKVNIDLDEQFLKKFFGLTDRILPDDQEISLLMLKRQLEEIEEMLTDAKMATQENEHLKQEKGASKTSYNQPSSQNAYDDAPISRDDLNLPKKSILIIDDLGVITYQLSVMFKGAGFDTMDSKEIYDAIEKFKKQDFDFVVMDLFIPTEREGFILLEELKKISHSKSKPVKIGIMSASSRKDHKQLCKIKGAEFYLEKIDDWQKDLMNTVKNLR